MFIVVRKDVAAQGTASVYGRSFLSEEEDAHP